MFCSLLAPIYLHLLSTTSLQNPSQLNITLLFCRLHPIDYRSFFFLFLSIAIFFLSQLSPAVIVKVMFSSFASLHLYPYFRIFVFLKLLCKNAFVSVMLLQLFSLLFSPSSLVIVLFLSFCPFFRVSFFEITFFLSCLLFSHSCCLCPILFIIIFNRFDRVIYLLFRIYFLPSHSSLLLLCHVEFSFPLYLLLLRFDHSSSIMPPFFRHVTTSTSSSILLRYLKIT